MSSTIQTEIASCKFPLTAQAVMQICVFLSQTRMDQVSVQDIKEATKLESSFIKKILDFLLSRNLIGWMTGDAIDADGNGVVLYHITEHGHRNGEYVLHYELSQLK